MEEEMERKLKDALDLCSFIRGADLGYVGDRMKVESMADALYELLSAPLPAAEPEPVAAGEVECLCNVNTQGSGDGTCPKCGPNLAAVLAALDRLEMFHLGKKGCGVVIPDSDPMKHDLAMLRAHISDLARVKAERDEAMDLVVEKDDLMGEFNVANVDLENERDELRREAARDEQRAEEMQGMLADARAEVARLREVVKNLPCYAARPGEGTLECRELCPACEAHALLGEAAK